MTIEEINAQGGLLGRKVEVIDGWVCLAGAREALAAQLLRHSADLGGVLLAMDNGRAPRSDLLAIPPLMAQNVSSLLLHLLERCLVHLDDSSKDEQTLSNAYGQRHTVEPLLSLLHAPRQQGLLLVLNIFLIRHEHSRPTSVGLMRLVSALLNKSLLSCKAGAELTLNNESSNFR